MTRTAESERDASAHPPAANRLHDLERAIEHAAHVLPSQGPITVFVHHNTLHAFEELPFHQAVLHGIETYGAQPYLSEDRYRQELARGRIMPEDLAATLIEQLGDDADWLLGSLGTRYHLRLAMLQHPLRTGTEDEIRWYIAETAALSRFQSHVRREARDRCVGQTRHWVMRDLRDGRIESDARSKGLVAGLFERFGAGKIEHWDDRTWETVALHLLWRICRNGVHNVPRHAGAETHAIRHRDLLLAATGQDSDALVNKILVRFCACFLDQGFASWELPDRDAGFLAAFASLYGDSTPVRRWMRGLSDELKRIATAGLSPLESIAQSLELLGVPPNETDEYVQQTLLALRGWAGMVWQMETNAAWTVHPAPRGTLVEFLAVRLILDRLAVQSIARESLNDRGKLPELRSRLRRQIHHVPRVSVDRRAFLVFQLAQARGWSPAELWRLGKEEWAALVDEIETFSSLERRRTYHLAYERRYRQQALDAISLHARRAPATPPAPAFQAITCIDDREESFRRHLEAADPDCETFGAAGFFGVAMYYRGAGDAHYRPLCPVIVTPKHYVTEDVVYTFEQAHRRRADTRRALGRASHQFHVGSRTFFGGMATAIVGPLASIPLVARVLAPRLTARISRTLGSFVQPPPVTRLSLERSHDPPGPDNGHRGYTVDEMTSIVERQLRDIALTERFSRLVIFIGHGSSSLNNPHESAYNCGACSGGRGGPNARAFAEMANDARVRARLAEAGVAIPHETIFLGAYHNTCDDSVVFFDLDRLDGAHRDDLERARRALDEARRRNAHERCRRFESADLSLSADAALRHVETRSEDLSQARPEYNHATCAMCFVGRRDWSRGLFADRRAFLTSYDPAQDDAEHSILARILQAAIPVCAGISLEYYFSCVDSAGYGCSSKLPHNITSLLGVMEGAASDLRTGLSQQMIEIHEPLRIVFVIETSPEAMLSIMDRNPVIGRLVRNEWVQLAVLHPDPSHVLVYRDGRFEPHVVESAELPTVAESRDWYRGWRDHLGFASIVEPARRGAAPAREAAR